MTLFWSKEADAILSIGLSLEYCGVKNWALTRQQALLALERLEKYGIAVLGGDVYSVADNSIEPNYDNWYCDREGGESATAFVTRSIAKAKIYVSGYAASDAAVIFAIVPEVRAIGV